MGRRLGPKGCFQQYPWSWHQKTSRQGSSGGESGGEDDPRSMRTTSGAKGFYHRKEILFARRVKVRERDPQGSLTVHSFSSSEGGRRHTPGMMPGSNAASRELSWACRCRSSLIRHSMALSSDLTPDKTSALTILAGRSTSLGFMARLSLQLASVAS